MTLHRMLYQYSLNVRFKDQPPPAVPNSSELAKLEERLGCGLLALTNLLSLFSSQASFRARCQSCFTFPGSLTDNSSPAVTSRLCP